SLHRWHCLASCAHTIGREVDGKSAADQPPAVEGPENGTITAAEIAYSASRCDLTQKKWQVCRQEVRVKARALLEMGHRASAYGSERAAERLTPTKKRTEPWFGRIFSSARENRYGPGVTGPARWGLRRGALDRLDKVGLARPAVRLYE